MGAARALRLTGKRLESMIIDRLEHWEHYSNAPAWRTAFEYLLALGPDAPDGDMAPISGTDIMARVMSYPTKTPDEAVVEAHDRYIDIQMALVNSEVIDWFPRETLEVSRAYDPASDAVLFHRPGPAPVRVVNAPGQFTVLFPWDAHMPQLVAGAAPETVKKVVVKLRADLFRG